MRETYNATRPTRVENIKIGDRIALTGHVIEKVVSDTEVTLTVKWPDETTSKSFTYPIGKKLDVWKTILTPYGKRKVAQGGVVEW